LEKNAYLVAAFTLTMHHGFGQNGWRGSQLPDFLPQ
jgi:hypothetical protein